MARLNLHLLGTPRYELDDAPLKVERQKAVALLVYLAVGAQSHSRETLATLFWPESEPSRAYANLRRILFELNQSLPEGWIEAERDSLALSPAADIWVDAVHFQALLAAREAHPHPSGEVCPQCIPLLKEALDLYRGEFLSGFSLADSPGFDEWQFFQADALQREYSASLEALSAAYAAAGDSHAAVELAQRWLALDPLNERAHQQIMRLYAWSHRRDAALRQYQELTRLLEEELDVQPEEATTDLYEQIRAGELEAPWADAAPAFQAAPPPNNLPTQTTPFIGRAAELAEIEALLADPDCRLLSLVGPGGIGKTRLALRAAEDQLAGFPHGVFFVPLAPLSSPDLLVVALAEAAQYSFQSTDDPDGGRSDARGQLLNYLQQKRMLLVMDNFEHLVEGAGLLEAILSQAAGIKLLVTSRQRLNLPAEWVLEVHGLKFPQNGHSTPAESFSSVQLFLENARRAVVGFSPTTADLPWVAQICRSVEGMPLGIELAASWVKILSVREIAGEIERNLDFLESEQRGVPSRHKSLRAIFNHSWELLSPAEQASFKRLSVFQGGCTREAAAQVAGAGLSVVAALADKSLLRRTGGEGGETRYDMHELLKQYAAAKLQEDSAEAHAARKAHADYYARFLTEQRAQIKGVTQLEAVRAIEIDLQNLRAAWRWAVEQVDLSLIEACMKTLAPFFGITSRFQTGEELFGWAVERLSREPAQDGESDRLDATLTFLRGAQGNLCMGTSHYEKGMALLLASLASADQIEDRETRALLYILIDFGSAIDTNETHLHQRYQENLGYYQASGDDWGLALSHSVYGTVLDFLGKQGPARELYQRSLAVFQRLGDPWGQAINLHRLAVLEFIQGRSGDSRELFLEALGHLRQIGDHWRLLDSLTFLSLNASASGAHDQAVAYADEGLAIAEQLGNRKFMGDQLDTLGYIHFCKGESTQAEKHYRRSLTISQEIDDTRGIGMSLMNLGDVEFEAGRFAPAKEKYLQGLHQLEKIDQPWGMMICQKRLGRASLALGEHEQAWGYYRQALEASLRWVDYRELTEMLVGIADLLAAEDRSNAARRLLIVCLAHPAMIQVVREKAEALLSGLPAESQGAAPVNPEDAAELLIACAEAILADQPLP